MSKSNEPIEGEVIERGKPATHTVPPQGQPSAEQSVRGLPLGMAALIMSPVPALGLLMALFAVIMARVYRSSLILPIIALLIALISTSIFFGFIALLRAIF